MTFPDYTVPCLPVVPATTLFDASEFDAALALDTQLRRAAAARLWRARAALAERKRRAEAQLSEELANAREDMAARIASAERDALADVLSWHVEQAGLEALVAERVATRVAECAADAFVAFTRDEARAPLMAARIREAIATLDAATPGTLSMHPAQLPEVAALLAALTCQLKADDTLPPGQAILDTPFVRIVIDIERHAGLLAEHLRKPLPQSAVESVQA